MPERFEPPGPCPLCGTDVDAAASACPECGACHGSGWSEQAAYDALDLPDSDFDHESFVREELAAPGQLRRRPWWIVITAAALILLLLLWLLA